LVLERVDAVVFSVPGDAFLAKCVDGGLDGILVRFVALIAFALEAMHLCDLYFDGKRFFSVHLEQAV
jgi:hypothetical protein